jgi:hypothetical protein
MEAPKTPEQTIFYVGRPTEGRTLKAFSHGNPRRIAFALADVMLGSYEFAVIVHRAVGIWISRDRTYWRDRVAGAFSKTEWESSSKTLTTRCISIRKKKQSFFCVGSGNYPHGLFHGRPIDTANSLADAMSKQVEMALIVCQGWYSWGCYNRRRARERIAKQGFDPEWMSLSRTVCTYYSSDYLNVFPELTERIHAWIEEVHKLLSNSEEFFKRGMPDFPWHESEKPKERDDQKIAKTFKAAYFYDRSELGKKRMEKLAEKSKEFWKKRLDPDDEPPDIIA